ncbi:copper chaperone PCu(A)C [Roseovarius sp. D0-M9]|uniref:copper chaperone PCu(A)C n=1 Tax=Roseovarius sp. D0-M9 TaxID=3127117 RepID=UPI0030100A47
MELSDMLKKLVIIAACAVSSTALWAHEFTAGDLEIAHPYAFETPSMAMAGGGFMTITNTGDTADRLIEVRADFPKVAVHESVVTDGVGRMLPVDGVEIAPGASVTLKPGGLHVMFMGLKDRKLVSGKSFPATLVFERAGSCDVHGS